MRCAYIFQIKYIMYSCDTIHLQIQKYINFYQSCILLNAFTICCATFLITLADFIVMCILNLLLLGHVYKNFLPQIPVSWVMK